MFAARMLPAHHLSNSSASTVKLLAAVVVSLTSLVLALMLSSANNSFAVNAEIVKKLSSDLIHLDHLLRTYGPEANEARANLRAYTTRKNEELFPMSAMSAPTDRETSDRLDTLLDFVLSLAPADRRHTALVEQALGITSSIYAERWLLWENPGSTVPPQFLFVLIFWLFLIFVSFGLFAPANRTVIASFLLSSLAVAGAILEDSRHGRSDASRLGSGLRRADAPRGDRGRPPVRMPFAAGPTGQAAGRTTLDCDTIVAIHP